MKHLVPRTLVLISVLAAAAAAVAPASAKGRTIDAHYGLYWGGLMVADGNMTAFLPQIADIFDGFMCENPATPLEAVIEHFGHPGKFIVGGVETVRLATGTPDNVRDMVLALHEKTPACAARWVRHRVLSIPYHYKVYCTGDECQIPDEKKQKNYKKLSGMTLPQRDNRRLDGA